MRLMSIEQQDPLTVSEEECREFKPAILQPCNQVDCPPAWETEPWQLVWTIFLCMFVYVFDCVYHKNLSNSSFPTSIFFFYLCVAPVLPVLWWGGPGTKSPL